MFQLNKIGWVVLTALAMILALVILFVSMARASLPDVFKRLSSHEYHNVLLTLRPVYADQLEDTGVLSYHLPEVGILPGNPFYVFRVMRDFIWLRLTTDPVAKTKLLGHMADKKMAEAVALMGDSKFKLTYESVSEAANYLEEMRLSLNNIKGQKDMVKDLGLQMLKSGRAYAMIISNFPNSTINPEDDQKSVWLDNFNKWNETFATVEE
jgi:hypothetical protein